MTHPMMSSFSSAENCLIPYFLPICYRLASISLKNVYLISLRRFILLLMALSSANFLMNWIV
jgi:hypothetical protein